MSVVAPPVPAPVDPLIAESIVASIGIETFVDATFTRVHGYHLDRAAKLPADIATKVHRFLTRTEPETQDELPPFDFEQVTAELVTEVSPEQVVTEAAAFGADMDTAIQVNLVVQRIRAYLVAHIPRLIRPSLAGPISETPAPSDVARFRRMWVVACDPMTVLGDLNEFALSRDQVTAFADLYPALYAQVWPIAQTQLARRKTVDPKWELARRKELLLRILVRQENTNVALGQALQTLYAQQATPATPGAPAAGKRGESMADEASASAKV